MKAIHRLRLHAVGLKAKRNDIDEIEGNLGDGKTFTQPRLAFRNREKDFVSYKRDKHDKSLYDTQKKRKRKSFWLCRKADFGTWEH